MSTLLHPDYPLLSISDDLFINNQLVVTDYRQSEVYGLTGSVSLLTAKILAGTRLTLAGGENYGILTGLELAALKTMADIRKVMTLNYHSNIYTVVFDYSDHPVLADKIQLKAVDSVSDYYNNVKINLIKV